MRTPSSIREETERMKADLANGANVTDYARMFGGAGFDAYLDRARADRGQIEVMRAWLEQVAAYLDGLEAHVPIVEVRRTKHMRSIMRGGR